MPRPPEQWRRSELPGDRPFVIAPDRRYHKPRSPDRSYIPASDDLVFIDIGNGVPEI